MRGFDLAGRAALITGGAGGIGLAIARRFGAAGARVVLADINKEAADRAVTELERSGCRAVALAADVSRSAEAESMVRGALQAFGAIDILVNNAGIVVGGPIAGADYPKQWEQTIAINLAAQVHLIRACLDQITRNGDGRIVNVASTDGLGATAFISPYTVSKHGVIGLTRSLAVELGAAGVTVNCICPGPIHTGMTAALPDDAKTKFARRRVPARRYGDPEEVAQITLSIVLPAASYLNGAIIPVDGGLIAQNT